MDLTSRILKLTKMSNLEVRGSKSTKAYYFEFLVGKHVVASAFTYPEALAVAKGIEVGRSLAKMEDSV